MLISPLFNQGMQGGMNLPLENYPPPAHRASHPPPPEKENFLISHLFQQLFRSPISVNFYVPMQVSPDLRKNIISHMAA